jgi:prevent-host-death family protein
MQQINIHEAKTQLSKLIADGKEVIIARYGQPVARLVPIRSSNEDRVLGTDRGKVTMKDSFFDPLPEDMLDEWEG